MSDEVIAKVQAAEIERLRRIITEMDAELAMLRGTLAKRDAEADQPAVIEHDIAPNAPR